MTIKEIGTTEIPTTLAQPAGNSSTRQARREVEAAAAAANEEVARLASQRASAKRSRRSNLGGAQLKLEITATIDGFHLYWENDVDARIERLLSEGFDFVTPSEVGMRNVTGRIVADTDITDRVSKYVGTTDDGKPMRAFLMKCPLDLWEDIQDCIADLADSRDQDILDSANRATGDRYKPTGYESKITSGRR